MAAVCWAQAKAPRTGGHGSSQRMSRAKVVQGHLSNLWVGTGQMISSCPSPEAAAAALALAMLYRDIKRSAMPEFPGALGG